MRNSGIEKLITTRAERAAQARYLEVDYYRIRRKIAYPLPMAEFHMPVLPVRNLTDRYPWGTWMAWELEERVHCLAWAGQWTDNQKYCQLAERDLAALAHWPTYDHTDPPGLMFGHTVRLMVIALRQWEWLSDEVRLALRKACDRAINEQSEWFLGERAQLQTEKAVLQRATHSTTILHNIPSIASLALAMAAREIDHPLQEQADAFCASLLRALLTSRKHGHTEAVAYDGYLADFAVDWLAGIDEAVRNELLEHPQREALLAQSTQLMCPGAPENVAPLGDVEPREMPFHLSVHAKLTRMKPSPMSQGYLESIPLDWVRSDGLAAMHDLPEATSSQPITGAIEGQYAYVLRSGISPTDFSLVMSAATSPMGHLHLDAGSLVIGSGGKWLIDDPGYQQYLASSEREYTVGAYAHNCPVINGQAQTLRAPERVECTELEPGKWTATVDMTRCYEGDAQVTRATRNVTADASGVIIVRDHIDTNGPTTVEYAWHGNPDAYWWVENGVATIYSHPVRLRFRCLQADLHPEDLDRMPGSRGQLSMRTRIESQNAADIVWVFSFADDLPAETSI